MTAVEWQFNELQKIEKAWANEVIDGIEFVKMKYEILEQAKEMEKEKKIEFACKVVEVSSEKYIQGKTTWQIAEELLTKQ